MSRKKTEINPVRAERVKLVVKRSNMTQKAFAEKIGMCQQNLSRICNSKTGLTEYAAQAIVDAFPDEHYRIEWLLGFDNFMTHDDLRVYEMEKSESDYNDAFCMLSDSATKISKLHNVSIPVRMFDEGNDDIFIMISLLHDYADSLAYQYIFKKRSGFWNEIDYILEPENNADDD